MNYLFITNSREEELNNHEPIVHLTNYYTTCIDAANELGFDIYVGLNRKNANTVVCPEYPAVKFTYFGIFRNVYNIMQIYKAYIRLDAFLSANNIDVIHCNSPIGGFLGRICASKHNVKYIIYTAHGFHFHKTAPIFSRFLFRKIESYLAKKTDAILTINEEDYQSALKFKLRTNGEIFKIHGVGIDLPKTIVSKDEVLNFKRSIGLSENDLVLISMGDLNKNKNHSIVIDALAKIKDKRIHYIVCGIGDLEKTLRNKVNKCGLEHNIHFLGYRNDVYTLLLSADIFILPSYREGLSRALMEAMINKLPCLVSNIRGNVDLIDDGKGGYIFNPKDVTSLVNGILMLADEETLRKKMGEYNYKKIKPYVRDKVKEEIKAIYNKVTRQL